MRVLEEGALLFFGDGFEENEQSASLLLEGKQDSLRACRPQAGIPACSRQALLIPLLQIQSCRACALLGFFLPQNASMRASKFYFLGKGVTPSFVGRASLGDR